MYLLPEKNTKKKKFKCDKCSKCFWKKDTFKNHFQQVHLKLKEMCSLCGIFFHPLALNRHKKLACIIAPKMEFQCEFCSKNFTRKEHMDSHINRMHKKTEEREMIVFVAENESELNNDLWCIEMMA